jgi:hypothetical protein
LPFRGLYVGIQRRRHGADAATFGEWAYVAPERWVNDAFASVNTGDIVLLADIRGGPGNRLRE